MNTITDFLTDPSNANLINTILILIVGYILRALIVRIIHKKMKDIKLFHKIKKITTYIYFGIIVLLLIGIWIKPGSMGTYLGLASAGLAIALKDLLINIAAWAFIMIKKPFVVGDRIEIGDKAGDVIDQRVFQFTVMEIGNWVNSDQSTGRMIHIPNQMVFSHPLFNYSSGFKYIWNEVHVTLTFESDYKKAKALFLKIAEQYALHLTDSIEKELKEASKRYLVFYKNLTPIVYTEVKDSGIVLSIRYLCEPHRRRTTNEQIWEDVLTCIQEHDDIELAYQTFRMVQE
ncbi:MAG: mechanosensitive ion channel family protein [Clostridiales bacterium]|nr:mechanosensitive ion channel family protein [Clostridiales bacterium]